LDLRSQLYDIGLRKWERLSADTELPSTSGGKKKRTVDMDGLEENRCDETGKICYLSMVRDQKLSMNPELFCGKNINT